MAFQSTQAGEYRLGLRFDPKQPQVVFDLNQVNLEDADADAPMAAAEGVRGDWRLQTQPDGNGAYWLTRGGRRVATLPGRGQARRPRSWCWIPDRDGQPYAVAVNTSSDGVIEVYRLVEQGTAPVIRRFRGHQSTVHAMALSADRRYLATASADGSVGFWKVENLDSVEASVHLWGAMWKAGDQFVSATDVVEDGPLFERDIRAGDQLVKLQWFEPGGQSQQEATRPADMLKVLARADELMPTFFFRRNQTEIPPFQLHSAWDAAARLFVSKQDREWAYWHPRGYFDASMNGHKLFGWQINRDRNRDPEFFRAAEFRRRLERPQIMARLLAAGSLHQAMMTQDVEARVGVAHVRYLAASQPRVEFLSPSEGAAADGRTVEVRVRIATRAGQRLAPPKLFANAVAAGTGREVSRRTLDDGPFRNEYEFVWSAPTPNDPRIRLQVMAATLNDAVAEATVTVRRGKQVPRRKPRLILVSAGVSQYRDQSIPQLDFAAKNASAFATALTGGAAPLYSTRDVLLLNQRVTGPMWRVLAKQTADELRNDVTPDDLLVFYLSGHGVRSPSDGEYYYLGANARFADVWAGRYEDCLSFTDIARFADLPCRKLAILDTCHSGAIQSLKQRHLKSALRALQDDLVLTLTASEGHEQAFENPELGMGQFTYHLIDGLRGKADRSGNRDGVVSLTEVTSYVREQATAPSPGGMVQHPTFGPSELAEYVNMPLTRVATKAR